MRAEPWAQFSLKSTVGNNNRNFDYVMFHYVLIALTEQELHNAIIIM